MQRGALRRLRVRCRPPRPARSAGIPSVRAPSITLASEPPALVSTPAPLTTDVPFPPSAPGVAVEVNRRGQAVRCRTEAPARRRVYGFSCWRPALSKGRARREAPSSAPRFSAWDGAEVLRGSRPPLQSGQHARLTTSRSSAALFVSFTPSWRRNCAHKRLVPDAGAARPSQRQARAAPRARHPA